MISKDNQIHLKRFLTNPPHPSYIAGFIDGDGCIFIRKIMDGYQSGISITQSRTNILQIIRYHFGGTITSSSNRNNKVADVMDNANEYYHKHNIRNQYNLLIRSNEYSLLLHYIKNNVVIKNSQINCLIKFLQFVNLQSKGEEKEILYKNCSDYNAKILINNINFQNITIEYIAGLFDAEGCFYICLKRFSKFYISITQKNYPDVLIYISKLLGFGIIDSEKKLKIYKKSDCLNFINLINPHLIVKYNQAIAFETFLNTNDIVIKEEMYKICNREKHEIEAFNDLNKNKEGKEGYLENLRLKDLKQHVCKEVQLKEVQLKEVQLKEAQLKEVQLKEAQLKDVYREKSEKMKGEGNHNYGKKFTEETKKKMSVSIRDAKGGVSDETIIKVRDLLKEGHKNIDIQNLLNLPRHTITRIKNGEIVCRDEAKKDKKSLTQEELNLSKRKISVDDIIFVIEKFIDKLKPMQILDYFIEQNKNNITIDMIKNIKRNLQNGKSVIYESELSKERHEYYLNLLKLFTEINV
jgi:hypothetical protein